MSKCCTFGRGFCSGTEAWRFTYLLPCSSGMPHRLTACILRWKIKIKKPDQMEVPVTSHYVDVDSDAFRRQVLVTCLFNV